jgi:CRISPR-associated protein Cas2
MLNLYLVCYDICDDKRVKTVFKVMKGFGDHLQYSVFRCELTEMNLIRMKMALDDVIKVKEDQVLIFRLGPLDGTYTEQVEALGLPYEVAEHGALIV